MNHHIKHISIPKPCHQNWTDMDIVDQGRFCQSCQKTVTDFTGLNNEQILQALTYSGNTCGRLNEHQLQNLNVTLAIKQASGFSWKKFSLATAFFGLVPFIKMEAAVKQPVLENTMPIKLLLAQPDTDKRFRTVTGTVKSDDDGLGLPGASIRVKGTSVEAVSDVNGHYSIDVPVSKDTLTINYIGYIPKQIKIDPAKENTGEAVMIVDQTAAVLSSVVVGGIAVRRSFAWRAWHTITSPFRAK